MRTITATRFGSPASRARQALARALAPDLDLDDRLDARAALERAVPAADLRQYERERERVLDQIASYAAAQIAPVTQGRDELHRRANRNEAERLETAERVPGLVKARTGAIA
jgi:hypothetical protein